MRLIRDAWAELWRNNRGGGVLTLAFWYTVITTLYQYFVASRLGPSLPKSLVNMIDHPGTVAALPHLPSALWVKLVLVYLTFLIIILPYTVGGLYGGVASAMREKPRFTGFLAFFRFGYLNFWRALGQMLSAILYALAVMAVLIGIFAVLSAFGSGGVLLSGIAIIAAALGGLWFIGTMLYWFGRTFSTDAPSLQGFLPTLRWGLAHLGQLYSQMFILVGFLLATLFVASFLADTIPILGAAILVLIVGMVAPAFLATYAILLYNQSPSA